jgi:hypothetical protein
MQVQVGVPRLELVVRTELSPQISGQTQMPQEPPQPLLPQSLPAQFGTQPTPQVPSEPQEPPPLQLPVVHLPPQPSGSPQLFPVQLGTQVLQYPAVEQVPLAQVPPWQRPPQPSEAPQAAPAQLGVHVWQPPWMQNGLELVQARPQSPPHPSEPQFLPVQLGVQLPHVPATQVPLVPQLVPQVPQLLRSLPRATQALLQQERPFKQVPEQVPPHPSLSPQCLPVQTGAHASAAGAAVSGMDASGVAASGVAASGLVASGAARGPSVVMIVTSWPASGVTAELSGTTRASATPASGPTTGPLSGARRGASTGKTGVVSGLATSSPGLTGTSIATAGPSTWPTGVASLLATVLPPQPTTTRGVTKTKSASAR